MSSMERFSGYRERILKLSCKSSSSQLYSVFPSTILSQMYGNCSCKPNVIGSKCDMCSAGFFDVRQGCLGMPDFVLVITCTYQSFLTGCVCSDFHFIFIFYVLHWENRSSSCWTDQLLSSPNSTGNLKRIVQYLEEVFY